MELVVLSGKGGTGKTTVAAALSELAKDVVKVDCDVDAPNFYLFYKGNNIEKEEFYGGKKAVIDGNICIKCGKCQEICRFDAVEDYSVNAYKCEGCGACVLVCPKDAVKLIDTKDADTFITMTDKGIISRAEMDVGGEGSGKLVTMLRKNVRKFISEGILTIIDGPPGIGCAAIASITGSNIVLIVTEPTKTAMEDLIRAASLCRHFNILPLVCINKYDLNEHIAEEIQKYCADQGYEVIGRIPYDDTVIKSINELKPIIYYEESTANKAIRDMWEHIVEYINV